MEVIDSHVHCDEELFPAYLNLIREQQIRGAIMFPPVSRIYDRIDKNFKDNQEWQNRRKNANEYILSLTGKDFKVFPFYFVWNDFDLERISRYMGIKWHRHINEPEYEYSSEKYEGFIKEIKKRSLPVILEEEFKNTLRFIDSNPEIKVIIPHLGILNGGYRKLYEFEVWKRENIYADTALADQNDITDYIKNYGCSKLFFGSDFPFGNPSEELEKILRLDVGDETKKRITSNNILNFLQPHLNL